MKKSVSILALGVLSLGMVATVACGGGEQKAPAPAEAPKVIEEKTTTTTTTAPATAAPATPETAAPATPSTTTTSTTTTSTTTTAPEKK